MLLYVIPFILLLIVAIFLKKRETSQKEDNTSSNKTSAKKASKKAAKTKSPATVEAIQTHAAPVSKTTPLPADVRQKIEQRIQSRDFFAAEALINQALNRDSSQHELYLLLLDIHLQQKDEFAINQLISQLRTLDLDDILQQAESKQQAYQQQKQAEVAVQAIVDTPPVVAEKPQFSPSTPHPSARSEDFDALVKPVEAVSSFDQIQAELNPAKAEPSVEIAPLEFTLSTTTNTKTQEAVVETATPAITEEAVDLSKGLEFKLDTPVVEIAPTTPVVEIANEPEQADVKAAEPKPLEFSFTLESSPAITSETTETAIIEEAPAPVILTDEAAKKAAEPEFKLDFDFETSTASRHEAPVVAETVAETAAFSLPSNLDFNLDTPAGNLEVAPETKLASEEPAVVAAAVSVVADSSDPLAQSFPELLQVNEISLNLQLAQQYIQLGAYASARRLLSENAAHFSPEQREQSDLLLKQIAS